MSAREEILARIRARLGRDAGDCEPAGSDTGAGPPIQPVVADDLVAHFTSKAEAVAATVAVVAAPDQVAEAIASYLESKGLATEVTTGDDPWLAGLPWPQVGIRVSAFQPHETRRAAVSHAAFAVAETGSVVLASGADNPVTLGFLPDNHIVVVERPLIVAHQEEVWPLFLQQGMPRALSFITGPSRTADIEFDIQIGAHGPRHLHIIIVTS